MTTFTKSTPTPALKEFTFVVLGGGIAGVSCAESLPFWSPDCSVLLVTASPIVKTATKAIQLTKTLTQLEVEEVSAECISEKNPGVEILTDVVVSLDSDKRQVRTRNGSVVKYKKLCICTGGVPNLIDDSNPHVIGIRDTESVVEFQKRVSSARKMLILGNGGIASEIVHEIRGIEKVWVIKDDHISKTFVDAGAAEFLRSKLEAGKEKEKAKTIVKRVVYQVDNESHKIENIRHAALGPDWHFQFDINPGATAQNLTVEYGASIKNIFLGAGDWPLRVELSNGKTHDVDFVVSATGVVPNSKIFKTGNERLQIAEDGGIFVDWKMETTLPDVFAAGDVCTAGWTPAAHWHQMRLWTQARQMGLYAAKSMASSLNGEPLLQDFCFEIFSHVTKFFGYKVILLGLFNGQKLGSDYELLLRVTNGVEYVKVVLKDGKMQGAILIGETDLEEMCENLILNQLDLTPYGEDLLNPNIDIEDYFD